MTIVTLDGIRTRLELPDIDKDGKSGSDEIETVTQRIAEDIQPIVQPTELGDSLKELNLDKLDINTRMSDIDLRAHLHRFEQPSVLALDSLVSLGFLQTKTLGFTRQKKRLSVSLEGRGRDDIVKIVGGKREHDEKAQASGFGDKIRSFVGMGWL